VADPVEKRLRQLDALVEMTMLVNSSLDTQQVRQRSIEAATRLAAAEAGSLSLLYPKTRELFFEVAVGERRDELKSVRIAPGAGIAGYVADSGQPVVVHDVRNNPFFFKGADDVSGFGTRDMICVPVRYKRRTLGVLQAINKLEGTFETDDMVILHALANQIAMAIENAKLYQDSISDGLTGLYQRRYFEIRLREEFDRARRYEHRLSLLMIDIDHFKAVNDAHGHQTGDEVLRGVASVLCNETRTSDVVARYGGEEFSVIAPYAPREMVLMVAERLRAAVARRVPGRVGHGEHRCRLLGGGHRRARSRRFAPTRRRGPLRGQGREARPNRRSLSRA
jgi:diguanylate cyclase (GGDEF)-like protein